MSFEMSGRPQRWLASAMAGAALLGCGGNGAESEPPAAQSFEQRAQALAAQGNEAATPPQLSAPTGAQVQQRSREWAVGAIYGASSSTGTVMTTPPLYFGLAFALEAAARGDTLAALNAQLPAAEPLVRAALQRGLSRSLRASASATFEPSFLDAVTTASEPGTWAALTLNPLTPQQLAFEPNLRLAITDSVGGTWAWPSAGAYDGVHQFPNGHRIKVPMLRVRGPVLEQAGNGYEASSMAVGKGHWLVRVVPNGTPAALGAAGLSAALAAVVPTLTSEAAARAPQGTWQVPATGTAQTAGLDDRRGMVSAMNQVSADLRGLDGGGTYLKAPAGSGSLALGPTGLRYQALQPFEFIFSPLNIHGSGGYSAGSVFVSSTFIDFILPPCPSERADLRPYFLALVQPGGNIAMLARLDSHDSTACSG